MRKPVKVTVRRTPDGDYTVEKLVNIESLYANDGKTECRVGTTVKQETVEKWCLSSHVECTILQHKTW